MEEKERYELFGEFGIIHDTSPNAECMLLNKFQTCEILNRQDKEIQQLKQQLLEYQEQSIRDNQNWIAETTELQQQLHDLPKKIVEEIKEKLFNHFKVKNIEEYEKLSLIASLFTADTVIKILDTILKKYGGEDE